jgi:hypothetical protein
MGIRRGMRSAVVVMMGGEDRSLFHPVDAIHIERAIALTFA